MKKKLFLMLALVCALSCLFILSVSANAVVSEKNIDESGDVFANYLGDYTIDNSSQNISSIDISYKTESGATKEGKLYFATNLWGSNRQIHSTYIPADFDMSQTVYMPDKIDINGERIVNVHHNRPFIQWITLDLDRCIFHENYNLDKIYKLTSENPPLVEIEKHWPEEQWIIVRSAQEGVSAREVCKNAGMEELRNYKLRSKKHIDELRKNGLR